MPQANLQSTRALASQGGYQWHFADCGRRYDTLISFYVTALMIMTWACRELYSGAYMKGAAKG